MYPFMQESKKINNTDKIENKDFTTLFKDFYHNVSGKDLDSEKQNIVTNILSNIEY